MSSTISLTEVTDGAAGEIRTPEVRHHWISNPAQWPGYAITAAKRATGSLVMNLTVEESMKLSEEFFEIVRHVSGCLISLSRSNNPLQASTTLDRKWDE